MLEIAPDVVNMERAVDDYHQGTGRLTRTAGTAEGVYSASGVFGNARLATKEKGESFVAALFAGIRKEIEEFKNENAT